MYKHCAFRLSLTLYIVLFMAKNHAMMSLGKSTSEFTRLLPVCTDMPNFFFQNFPD